MAAQSRRTDSSVARTLFEEGYRFDFFQAVRLLERIYPQREPIGGDGPFAHEIVRFRTRLSLAFPASDIHEIVESHDADDRAQIVVAFMGLTGPSGVLPRHYTELLIERVAAKDSALRDFLDLFNHRLISLFYRAWEKHHFPVAYERTLAKKQGHDRFSQHLFALIGLGLRGLRGRLPLDDESLLLYSGLLHQRPRSACALEQMLSGYFGVPVTALQFQGQWVELADEDCTRLGRSGRGEGNNALGVSAIAGTNIWDQQARFRVRLGPLQAVQFRRFLPSGSAFSRLFHVTELFAGQEFEFDFQPVLQASEVPACRLGTVEAGSSQLGWSTWLKTRDFQHDAEDAVITSRFAEMWTSSQQNERVAQRGAA